MTSAPRPRQTLTGLENRLVASDSARALPRYLRDLEQARRHSQCQTQHAVAQAEQRLASGARVTGQQQAPQPLSRRRPGADRCRSCPWSCRYGSPSDLARQLHGLRDSALDLANVRLPDVVRRLRAGEDVDVAAQVGPLDAGVDEIGQVKAAFNTAQRTAVEAAVDEARVRRGINDVFRNLARRSQSLLERQLALLDALERRAMDPAIWRACSVSII